VMTREADRRPDNHRLSNICPHQDPAQGLTIGPIRNT
jgi:hypothetical protein